MAITRTVTVFDQNTQEKTVLQNVTAETFGELKTVLRAKGISLDGMDVREGISKVDLRSDSAQLPHDTPYRGSTTNDLMILLTKTNKKISSGAMGRSEAVAYIKNHNLQEAVKDQFKKNWTNVPTDALVKFVEDHKATQTPAVPEVKAPAKEAPAKEEKGCDSCPKEFCQRLVEILYANEAIDDEDREELEGILGGKASSAKTKDPDAGFSDDEIYAAIRSM